MDSRLAGCEGLKRQTFGMLVMDVTSGSITAVGNDLNRRITTHHLLKSNPYNRSLKNMA
jgi:hypothetical protein